MAEKSKIEWTDHTFNPWEGCQKVGPGCDHCYAEARNTRFGGGVAVNWGAGAPRRRTSAANWNLPLRWNAQHEAFFAQHGRRQRVFCASLADVFDNSVPVQWRADLLQLIDLTPHLDWLLLTKRIGNVIPMLKDIRRAAGGALAFDLWPRPNIWLGATICNQEEADRDIPKLLAVPAEKRFLSMEPLLGPVDIQTSLNRMPWRIGGGNAELHWIIAGGESGPGARPMHPHWVRSLRDQCISACVPFFFKQHGEWLATDFCDDAQACIPHKRLVYVRPDGSFHDGAQGVDFFGGEQETAWIGKKVSGRVLDGREWNEVPA